MNIHDLTAALRVLKIAEAKSVRKADGSVVYAFEGRLPGFPFRSRVVSYILALQGPDTIVQPEEIEAVLLHFWQGQVDVSDLQAPLNRDPP